jgi:ABC-type sugar transport system ATPase subunit
MSGSGIEIQKLCFKIGNFEMTDLQLSVPRGEYFVLTGPNGSGKSLMIKLLCGIYQPLSGVIRINGRNVHDLPPWERRIGYVPQEGGLFPNRTVQGNIGFGLEVAGVAKDVLRKSVLEIAEMLGITHLLERKPGGLSGGERQKTSLARALVLEPDILLLDEPVSAIDELSRDKVCRELRDIQQKLKITTLHVSHNRLETELVADRVGVIRNGSMQVESAGL